MLHNSQSVSDVSGFDCRHQQDLVQQRVQLDKDRAMLVADAQSLHDSTYELCTLRDALAEEKNTLASGLQQLQTLQRQTSLEQTAVTQQVAAVADAEGKLQQLQLQISEKQAELSDQNLKVRLLLQHSQLETCQVGIGEVYVQPIAGAAVVIGGHRACSGRESAKTLACATSRSTSPVATVDKQQSGPAGSCCAVGCYCFGQRWG